MKSKKRIKLLKKEAKNTLKSLQAAIAEYYSRSTQCDQVMIAIAKEDISYIIKDIDYITGT